MYTIIYVFYILKAVDTVLHVYLHWAKQKSWKQKNTPHSRAQLLREGSDETSHLFLPSAL